MTTPVAQLAGSQLLEIIEKRDTMLDDLLEEVRKSPPSQRGGVLRA